jgi:hypothetical protein
VPSSISNSESGSSALVPRRSVIRAVGVAGASAVATLVGLEVFWRRRGFRPEINDSPELWCAERTRAVEQPHVLAIVGSSRMQFGIDPQALARALPGKNVVHLAIKGVPALPVLRSLAADSAFQGTVLCEVTPQQFFTSEPRDMEPVQWLEFYENRPWVSPIEGRLRLMAQQVSAELQPLLELRSVAMSLLAGGGLPKPPYLRLRPDRFMEAHYARVDAKRFQPGLVARARKEAQVPSESALLDSFERLRGYGRALAERGGKLIFVRMISSGPVRELEDQLFPRERYWDRLLAEVGAPGIYFDEVPGSAGLECPDASHLDVRDAPRFSASLGQLLRRRKLA